MTRVDRYSLDALLADPMRMQDVADRFAEGAIAVYPTETIYGIGGCGNLESVRQKILTAKQRPPDNPMILIAGSLNAFASLEVQFPVVAQKLADTFWPGNLTMVLPVVSRDDYIGIRVSPHPFIKALSDCAPFPIYSTSANISGEPYDGTPDLLFKLFESSVDFMIDAGVLPTGTPSTVVRISPESQVEVLREGVISKARIYEACQGLN